VLNASRKASLRVYLPYPDGGFGLFNSFSVIACVLIASLIPIRICYGTTRMPLG
jgi:hypothetical protein